jgi:hypothetical protein
MSSFRADGFFTDNLRAELAQAFLENYRQLFDEDHVELP